MAEDEPVEMTSAAVRPTPGEVAALMEAAIATARAEGIAVPPDLARKTFADDAQAGGAGTPARRGVARGPVTLWAIV